MDLYHGRASWCPKAEWICRKRSDLYFFASVPCISRSDYLISLPAAILSLLSLDTASCDKTKWLLFIMFRILLSNPSRYDALSTILWCEIEMKVEKNLLIEVRLERNCEDSIAKKISIIYTACLNCFCIKRAFSFRIRRKWQSINVGKCCISSKSYFGNFRLFLFCQKSISNCC